MLRFLPGKLCTSPSSTRADTPSPAHVRARLRRNEHSRACCASRSSVNGGELRLRRAFVVAAAATLALMWHPGTSADDWTPPGPAVGEPFPLQTALPDQSGTTRTLDELAGPHGLVLLFNRSADWCRYCRAQMVAANERVAAFDELGIAVVTVSVDTPELLKPFAEEFDIRYTMLADGEGETVEKLGLRDPSYPTGSSAYGVPQPGIFYVTPDGVVRDKFFIEGYKERPDLDEVLQDLRLQVVDRLLDRVREQRRRSG